MANVTEQEQLLTYHRGQQDAAQRTKAQYEAELATSGTPEALADMIAQQQAVIDREQVRIDDCLRNLGELPMADVLAQLIDANGEPVDVPQGDLATAIAEPKAIETDDTETSEDESAEKPKRAHRGH